MFSFKKYLVDDKHAEDPPGPLDYYNVTVVISLTLSNDGRRSRPVASCKGSCDL